jgi:hypothetical protein
LAPFGDHGYGEFAEKWGGALGDQGTGLGVGVRVGLLVDVRVGFLVDVRVGLLVDVRVGFLVDVRRVLVLVVVGFVLVFGGEGLLLNLGALAR